ncbi:nucleotidyltransferase family protein [Methylobacterium sp. GC_Met_2]|uniref:nucleotidyltransferase family protein n=1 Tax=Methylobacterium sp. GC_Met_2 TaxID=2937376 RepID=UPI00226B1AAB|nr:nucleotidyltransferase family protein [Methylobacterium sp. GC_Met_2]
MRDYAGRGVQADRGDTVTPAAWRVLEDNRLLNLCDPADRTDIDRHREAIWSMNAPALYTIAQLSRRLAADEIPHVFIKSPLLTHALHGDPFFRMSTDVDVLVSAADRTRALRVLDALGFQLSAACRTLFWRTFMGEQHLDPTRPDFLTVDLHTMARHPAGYAPGLTRSILAGRMMTALGDGHVPVPNPSDAFLLGAVYLLKSLLKYEPAGSHLLDLAVMHGRLDPERQQSITALAAARGLKRTTAFARDAVRMLLEPEIGTASRDAAPLRRALSGDEFWIRFLAPSECGPLGRVRCIAASCDRPSDTLKAVGWDTGRWLARHAADAGLF